MDKTASGPRRNRLAVLAVAGLAVVSMTAGAMSLALFTSSASVPSNAFTTGTVIIVTDHPATAIVSYSNMAPGDVVTNPLLVSNTGTLALRYAVESVATYDDFLFLKDELVLTVKSGVTTCTNAGFATDGTVLYDGDFGVHSGPFIGSPDPGFNTGDRALAASASETLCFHVSLPSATGNALQNATTTGTFTFYAEQIKNN
jgi:spore coat-associated protein N